MIGNETLQPKDISDYEKAEALKDDYHFFGCINFISQVKVGPFAEHSNQLWNISGVTSWNKVYTGEEERHSYIFERHELTCIFNDKL